MTEILRTSGCHIYLSSVPQLNHLGIDGGLGSWWVVVVGGGLVGGGGGWFFSVAEGALLLGGYSRYLGALRCCQGQEYQG